MPKISELRPGDLISDLDDDDHFMIWVGGENALVENVEANNFAGVFRHSHTKITKRLSQMAVEDNDDSDEELEGFAVFRCDKTAIAQRAAEFAIEWSTSKTDLLFVEGMSTLKQYDTLKLKVPFNQARLTHMRQQKPGEWDVRSLFRGLRVLARAQSDTPVSVKGWTCSSFATYCYQAAALAILLKDGPIRPELLNLIKNSGGTGYLSIKSDINIITLVLSDMTEIVRQLVPKGLLVDAKAIDATFLKDFLSQSNNGFSNLGNISQ